MKYLTTYANAAKMLRLTEISKAYVSLFFSKRIFNMYIFPFNRSGENRFDIHQIRIDLTRTSDAFYGATPDGGLKVFSIFMRPSFFYCRTIPNSAHNIGDVITIVNQDASAFMCHLTNINRLFSLIKIPLGVASNFEAFEGTGGGSTLQESPNITFSEKTGSAYVGSNT